MNKKQLVGVILAATITTNNHLSLGQTNAELTEDMKMQIENNLGISTINTNDSIRSSIVQTMVQHSAPETVPEPIVEEPKEVIVEREKDYIEQIIHDISIKYDFPEILIQAVVKAESNFNPNCVGPDTAYGNAHGLMQLIPSTAEMLGVSNMFDPYENVDGGVRYLIQLMDMYDDQEYYDHQGNLLTKYEMAIMAYNWGCGNLSNHVEANGFVVIADTEYGIARETYNYINKIRNFCNEGLLTYQTLEVQ